MSRVSPHPHDEHPDGLENIEILSFWLTSIQIAIATNGLTCTHDWIYTYIKIKFKIKSEAYSSQGSHTDQLDVCNWLPDGSTTG